VKLIHQKDTIIKSSDKEGWCSFNFIPEREYLLTVSHVGYRICNRPFFINGRYSFDMQVLLQEEAIEIKELFIKGDMAMMVIKGDTLKYNIGAFKTFEGDNLIEAVKMIPGVTIEGGSILHFGKPVNKVYVNNILLFGKENPSRALINLKAEEVKQVEVYEEATDESKRMGMETGDKQKVMNIVTKNKLNSVVNSNFTSAEGKERHNEECKYFLYGDYKSFNVKRQFESSLNVENMSLYNNVMIRHSSVIGSINYADQITPKLRIQSNNVINNALNDNHTIRNRIFSSQNSMSRITGDTTGLSHKSGKILSSLVLDYLPGSSDPIKLFFSYNGNRMTDSQNSSGTINESGTLLSRYDNTYFNSDRNSEISGSVNWTHSFRKPGRSFTTLLSYRSDKTWGDAWQKDTSDLSTNRYHIIKRKDGTGSSIIGNFRYSEPLLKGVLQLNYNISKSSSVYQRSSSDLLSGMIDTSATCDYSFNNLRQEIKLQYSKAGQGWNINASSGLNYVTYLKDEYFPDTYNFNKTIRGFSANLVFKKELTPRNLIDFSYTGTPSFPSVEELRGVVEYSNPLFLTAGNPDLESPYNHTAEIKYTHFTEQGSVITATVSGNNIINGLAEKKIYFAEDTYIGKYHFTFPEGSTLRSTVNVEGMWGGKSEISYSGNIDKIKSIVTITAGYNFSSTPFFINESAYFQTNNTFDLGLKFQSNFSRKLRLSLLSNSGKSLVYAHDLYSSEYFRQSVVLDSRARIFKIIDLRNMFHYNYYINTDVPGSKENYVIWNLFATGKIVKDKIDISLIIKDLLNSTSNKKTNISQDYFEMLYRTDVVKRTFMVSLSLSLHSRK
jgi:hypothetical protein